MSILHRTPVDRTVNGRSRKNSRSPKWFILPNLVALPSAHEAVQFGTNQRLGTADLALNSGSLPPGFGQYIAADCLAPGLAAECGPI